MDIPFERYPEVMARLLELDETSRRGHLRNLCRTDLYFLLRYVLNRPDVEHPWLFERCREVQQNPNGFLDLWSREHYKSTIITFAKNVQDILASHGEDPLPEWGGREVTIGIFSHTRNIAKDFVQQIRAEFENNTMLRGLFPDIIWDKPDRQAPHWSNTEITVKRQGNPRESTVEGWGLVDGQPTGKHFLILNYDDVVTRDSVTTPDMIQKTTKAWEESLNLGTTNGGLKRYIGTRWHYNDTYRTILERGAAQKRLYPATHDGEFTGTPVFWTQEQLNDKIREMGPQTAAAQLMQNPGADEKFGFKREWLRYYDNRSGAGMNKYLLCDPANAKKRDSDRTAIAVIGLGQDMNFYLLDLIIDRLNLEERATAIMLLHRTWKPLFTGYERYGKDSDIQHIEYLQEQQNYRFDITEIGGKMDKHDRIARLQPDHRAKRWFYPKELFRRMSTGETQDMIERYLIEEYDAYPAGYFDTLDVLSRIYDVDLVWPKATETKERYEMRKSRWRPSSWMGA